ncbi:Amino-acid acetyltransferase, mitochondrial [Dimargaris verticillata]|uniref:Amino-acid acetyltransferase, mitochondrial n=1 Tax=Dimargaris verticillata TaxID=2761393 RepID=A0A9W8B7K4_9FUNG|nr:Amino-acid acetyltransferase, mitochondrial [Dimargaris verticillata]
MVGSHQLQRWLSVAGPRHTNRAAQQLYLQVLEAYPSPREARHFLQRVTGRHHPPQLPSALPTSHSARATRSSLHRQAGQSTTSLPEDLWIQSLLYPQKRLVALVVVPIGLPESQLLRIAQTLVNLAQLGLAPVVVLDPCYPIDKNTLAESVVTPPEPVDECVHHPPCAQPQQLELPSRSAIMQQGLALTALIESIPGGRARPIFSGVFTANHGGPDAIEVDLAPIVSALTLKHIPLLAPISAQATQRTVAMRLVSMRKILTALTQAMCHQPFCIPRRSRDQPDRQDDGCFDVELANAHKRPLSEAATTPAEACKLIFISPEPVPSPLQSSDQTRSSSFVNLEDEYAELRQHLTAQLLAPSSRASLQISKTKAARRRSMIATLDTIQTCLSVLPSRSSALIVSADSVADTVHNWITDKPIPLRSTTTPSPQTHPENHERPNPLATQAVPPRWPHASSTLSSVAVQRAPTVVLRHGLKVAVHRSLDTVDLAKLQKLLEASFKRSLNQLAYWARLRQCLDMVIVAGDYQGAVVMTKELASIASPTPLPYLDKFAIDPQSQGIGIAEILWKNVARQYTTTPWTWRSRRDNGVNKWYYDKAHGHMRIPKTQWVCFWSGPEGWSQVDQFVTICRQIPPSFH